jgi:hypothetical protein
MMKKFPVSKIRGGSHNALLGKSFFAACYKSNYLIGLGSFTLAAPSLKS